MKEGWEIKKLGDICVKITDGSHNPPKGISKSDYLMLSSQNIQNGYLDMEKVRYLSEHDFRAEHSRTKAKKGDVLLTIVGTIGRTCVLNGSEGNITFQRSVAVLSPKPSVDSFYLMYSLFFLNDYLNKEANGAAQKGIYLNQLSNIDLAIPPLHEQQRIVKLLDAEFEKINRLMSNAELNLRHAKDLFHAALKTELEPKEGWEKKTLESICTILDKYRKPISKKDRIAGIYPYYGASCIQDYVNDYLFDGRYVLVGEDGAKWGCGEETAYIAEGKFWVNNHAHIIKVNDGIVDTYIVYYFACLDLTEHVAGAIIPKLTQETLRNLIIPMPSTAKQQTIVATLDSLKEKCKALQDNYTKTIALCDDLKQALLRKAFNGEL